MVVICPPEAKTWAMYPSMSEQVTEVFGVFGTSTATSLFLPGTQDINKPRILQVFWPIICLPTYKE
jgi:hypothetical protein